MSTKPTTTKTNTPSKKSLDEIESRKTNRCANLMKNYFNNQEIVEGAGLSWTTLLQAATTPNESTPYVVSNRLRRAGTVKSSFCARVALHTNAPTEIAFGIEAVLAGALKVDLSQIEALIKKAPALSEWDVLEGYKQGSVVQVLDRDVDRRAEMQSPPDDANGNALGKRDMPIVDRPVELATLYSTEAAIARAVPLVASEFGKISFREDAKAVDLGDGVFLSPSQAMIARFCFGVDVLALPEKGSDEAVELWNLKIRDSLVAVSESAGVCPTVEDGKITGYVDAEGASADVAFHYIMALPGVPVADDAVEGQDHRMLRVANPRVCEMYIALTSRLVGAEHVAKPLMEWCRLTSKQREDTFNLERAQSKAHRDYAEPEDATAEGMLAATSNWRGCDFVNPTIAVTNADGGSRREFLVCGSNGDVAVASNNLATMGPQDGEHYHAGCFEKKLKPLVVVFKALGALSIGKQPARALALPSGLNGATGNSKRKRATKKPTEREPAISQSSEIDALAGRLNSTDEKLNELVLSISKGGKYHDKLKNLKHMLQQNQAAQTALERSVKVLEKRLKTLEGGAAPSTLEDESDDYSDDDASSVVN